MWNRIPSAIVNLILEYDGRIKYRRGVYIDRLAETDPRFEIVSKILQKRIGVLQTVETGEANSFYFEVEFEGLECVGMAYSYSDIEGHFEICFFDFRELDDIVQIITAF